MPTGPAPLLLPTPHTLRLTGPAFACPPALAETIHACWSAINSGHPLPSHSPHLAIAETMHASSEHYQLAISCRPAPQITIRHAPRGLRPALATLRQLLALTPDSLPQLEIDDAPAFPTRGVMLDVSRDKVPTTDQLKSLIDLLAELKFNHLQLYTEHTFAYAGHEEVWADASPITPEEARELDTYAAAHGIELTANQNCFGHLSAFLKRPRYQSIAEIEPEGVWKFLTWDRKGPFSLCPIEPKAETFIADLLDQLLPNFTSPLVNIGCDETFDVGWGKSKALVAQASRLCSERLGIPIDQSSTANQHHTDISSDAQRLADLLTASLSHAPTKPTADTLLALARSHLFFDFVSKIARICDTHNKRPMMWADIALTHPEMLSRLPSSMIGLAWWYEPTDKFTQWISAIRSAGMDAWVCPGTSSWRSFTGRTTERRGNLADAAEQGLTAGANGFLACDWGDLGHRQQWPISLAAIANAAEAAWNPPKARAFDARAISLHIFKDDTQKLGPWIDALGDADLPLRRAAKLSNNTALFYDLHPPHPRDQAAIARGDHPVKAPIELWHDTRDRLAELDRTFPPVSDPIIAEELRLTLAIARFAADHAIYHREATDTLNGPAALGGQAVLGGPALRAGRTSLIGQLQHIITEHQRLWLKRNRPGGLDHSTSYYTDLLTPLVAG